MQSDTRPWSNAHFDAIETWHSDCRLSHPDCSRTLSKCRSFDVENVVLPTRCVEIQSVDEGAIPGSGLRFVLREPAGRTGKYIALSHRWTKEAEIARTTKANYLCRTQRCEHISPCTAWIDNPPTTLFKEASWLAVKLGIRYIWIDSICIVQDDDNDWARESIKMAEYYQYAWLTISATNTSEKGTLRSKLKTTDFPRIARLPYRDRNGQQRGHFYLQATAQSALAKDYREGVGNSTLLNRGWVFQEWLLSRRLLAFSNSSSGIFMQCQSSDTPKAVTGEMVDAGIDLGDQTIGTIDKAFKNNLPLDMSSKEGIFLSWRSIVETYSGLELTQLEGDRLVALSGIAAEYGQALQALTIREFAQTGRNTASMPHHYICGLWFGDITSLLWEQAEYRSPWRARGISTWSWASVGSRKPAKYGEEILVGVKVRWSEEHDNGEIVCAAEKAITIRVATKNWQPLFTSPTSQSESLYGNDSRFAVLKMRGRLQRVCIDAHFASKEDVNAAAIMTAHRPDFGRDTWRRVSTYTKPNIVAGWASVEHPDYQSDAECRSSSPIFAFFVVKLPSIKGYFSMGKLSGRHTAFRVLYLRQVERPEYAPCYERVGVGRLFENEVESNFKSAKEVNVWLI